MVYVFKCKEQYNDGNAKVDSMNAVRLDLLKFTKLEVVCHHSMNAVRLDLLYGIHQIGTHILAFYDAIIFDLFSDSRPIQRGKRRVRGPPSGSGLRDGAVHQTHQRLG